MLVVVVIPARDAVSPVTDTAIAIGDDATNAPTMPNTAAIVFIMVFPSLLFPHYINTFVFKRQTFILGVDFIKLIATMGAL